MALKPIDNTLPLPQEAIILGVNEENKTAASLPPADPIIDYISSGNLEPISDRESKIHGLVEELDSKDWTRVCESLNDARRFALYHSLLLFPILEKVVLVVVKAMKNPRSALCKTSIMASSDIFKLLQLLLKASQDKRFVCEEADRALNAMVKSMTPLPLLNKLRPYVSHSNPIQMAADLLNDRLPEAREAARNIVTCIYEAYTRNEERNRNHGKTFPIQFTTHSCPVNGQNY
ncbi:TOG array regulator of axonemal microtubules protein [Salix suchowensis]|nr:TOG array regulator of axonemal microtubules protein [Salix suchowensis]